MQSIRQCWDQITAWFQANQPVVVEQLNAPATAAQFAATEAALKVTLPDEFRQLYEIANGSDVDIPGVFENGHWFMPLEQIVEHAGIMSQFVEGRPIEDFAFWKSQIEDGMLMIRGAVKPQTYSPHWIPLTSSNGDVIRYIDLDPAPGGRVGQVIEVDTECASFAVIAESLTALLSRHAARLQSGEMKIEHDCLIDNEDPGGDWGVPEWLMQSGSPVPGISPAGEDDEMVVDGAMGMLAGTTDDIVFSLHPADGSELMCLATRNDTRGFGQIAIEQDATAKLRRLSPPRQSFLGTANFLVLDYRARR